VTVSEALNLSAMEMTLDRQKEWRQIFDECWRQMRISFYDPGMRGGLEGDAIAPRAAGAHVNHRADLTYVIGEMIAELNAGHAYVGGGEMPKPSRLPLGLLGAKLERDPQTGYFKIAKILRGANWDKTLRSPLTEVGVNVRQGEYIVAVNGRPANEVMNLYELLVNTAGKQTVLRVSAEPKTQGSRETTVVPIEGEAGWPATTGAGRASRSCAATSGRVGYLHVSDMLTGLQAGS
jgi:tricorn protease